MKRWPLAALVGLCLLGASNTTANADRLDFDEKIAAVDAWTVGYNRNRGSCIATASYGDDTTIWIGLDGDDGNVYLGFTNPNWQSIQDGKQYRLQIASVGGGRWQGPFIGITRNQDKGIIAHGLKEAFIKDLVRSPGIALSLGSRTIAKINLEGSPAAFAAVIDCQSKQTVAGTPKGGGNKSASKGGGSGTGFVISSQGHILTNSHVVEGCQAISVEQAGQSTIKGAVVARDKTNDLAVLKTTMTPLAVAAFKLNLRVGENVAVYGFPLSTRLATTGNFTVGYVSALAGIGDDTSKIQISAPIQPGNSGGPVLDHYGNVVGVIVSTATSAIIASAGGVAPQNINFAIKSVIAKNFLDASGIKTDGEVQNKKIYDFADLADRAKLSTVKILCD